MITAYGNNAEFAEKYLEKGIKIALSGDLTTDEQGNTGEFKLPCSATRTYTYYIL